MSSEELAQLLSSCRRMSLNGNTYWVFDGTEEVVGACYTLDGGTRAFVSYHESVGHGATVFEHDDALYLLENG